MTIPVLESMTFTPNGKRRGEIRVLPKMEEPRLILAHFFLLAPDIKQLHKGTRQVKMREFSRFYDKQEPVVFRLPLAVNVMLNLSDTNISTEFMPFPFSQE